MTVLVDITNTPHAWTRRAAARTSWEAAGWSARGQARRFTAVMRHLHPRLADGDRVLDFGCGTGALCDWLPDTVEYLAHDWAEGMRARVSADHPRALVLADITGIVADHTVAVGTFNLPGSVMRTQAELQKLWERTRKTLVASLYRGTDTRCLSYTAAELAEVAASCGCQRFAIDGLWLDNDLLLVMHREAL